MIILETQTRNKSNYQVNYDNLLVDKKVERLNGGRYLGYVPPSKKTGNYIIDNQNQQILISTNMEKHLRYRLWRLHCGKTQKQIAKSLRTSQNTISWFERGKKVSTKFLTNIENYMANKLNLPNQFL